MDNPIHELKIKEIVMMIINVIEDFNFEINKFSAYSDTIIRKFLIITDKKLIMWLNYRL